MKVSLASLKTLLLRASLFLILPADFPVNLYLFRAKSPNLFINLIRFLFFRRDQIPDGIFDDAVSFTPSYYWDDTRFDAHFTIAYH